MHHDHHSHSKCLEACLECHTHCLDTYYNYCLKMGGKHVEQEHLKLMADCIQICQTCTDFMTRNSKHHSSICAVCAIICNACAESCDRIGGDEMKRCAEMCRRCAAQCGEMGKVEKSGVATYS
jgi:hypothetical protein